MDVTRSWQTWTDSSFKGLLRTNEVVKKRQKVRKRIREVEEELQNNEGGLREMKLITKRTVIVSKVYELLGAALLFSHPTPTLVPSYLVYSLTNSHYFNFLLTYFLFTEVHNLQLHTVGITVRFHPHLLILLQIA